MRVRFWSPALIDWASSVANRASPAGIVIAGDHIWIVNSYIDATGGSLTQLRLSDGRWIKTLSSNSWMQGLFGSRCTHYLATGEYPFDNPRVIAAVGRRIWIFNGAVVMLTPR